VDDAGKPGAREFRSFGLSLGALIAAVFGVWPLLRSRHAALWPWIIAALLWFAALLRPTALRYLHRGWTRLGFVLGWINTSIILTVLFAISIVPLGLLMRLFGRDRMARKFDPNLASYRVESKLRAEKSMERPF
jgi:predicted membrane protein